MARVEIVAAVLTISDSASRGEREDRSGPAVIAEVEKLGGRIAAAEIVSDDLDLISAKVREFADRGDVNLILTTGGTGFAPAAGPFRPSAAKTKPIATLLADKEKAAGKRRRKFSEGLGAAQVWAA